MDKDEKAKCLIQTGMDGVVLRTFDQEFANVEGLHFPSFLIARIPTLEGLCVGENFRFGQGRVGDIQTLIKSGSALGIDVWSIDRIKQNGLPISSTRIREALRLGRVNLVNSLLGYRYVSEGTVIKGAHLGTKMGFPTMNLKWSPECKPRYLFQCQRK